MTSLNGHDICHGGLITTLVDSAFAVACNAYNKVTVAAGFDVNLLAPARLGDLRTATAAESSRSGRTGVYDVVVGNQLGHPLAAFRGRSHMIKAKPLVEGLVMGRTRPSMRPAFIRPIAASFQARRASRSPPRPTCARSTPLACLQCRASRCSACMRLRAPPASRQWWATSAATSTAGPG